MSNITCIASFLDIPSFAVSLVTTISSTYFNCLSDKNAQYIRRKSFSYVIGFLPILFKQLITAVQVIGSLPNSRSPSSHTTYTFGLLILYRDFFSLGQFSSFHHEVLFHFTSGSSFFLITVAVSCSAEL